MNVSGPQYSKSTQGLRQRDIIQDQKFKLVFAYPVLTERGLDKYTESIRDFISISMLKEIFINNAINIVKMASQVHSLTDEKGNIYNTIDMVNAARFGNAYAQNKFGFGREDPLTSAKAEISHKVNQKTAIIRELLGIDPKLKQLRPYVEIITMNNLIDVPVIVGTHVKDIDPKLLSLVLYQSVLLGIPLVDTDSVNRVFDSLKRTSNQELTLVISSAINNIDMREQDSISDTILDKTFYTVKDFIFHPNDSGARQRIKTERKEKRDINAFSRGNGSTSNPRIHSIRNNIRDVNTPKEYDEVFAILSGIKNNIAIDKNNFLEMVDKTRLKNTLRYRGFAGSEDVISDTISKYSGSVDTIKHNVNLHFNNMLSSRCYSYVMSTCYFLRNVANRSLDVENAIKENFYTGDPNLLDQSNQFINRFFNVFNSTVVPRTPIDKLSDKLNSINNIMDSLERGVKVIENTLTPGLQIPMHFDRKNTDVAHFLKKVAEMGPRTTKIYEGTIKVLDGLFPDLHLSEMRHNFEDISDRLYNRIINEISEVRNLIVINDEDGMDEIAAFKYGFIDYNSGGRNTIAQFKKDFSKYFRIMVSLLLLYSIIVGLFEYIDVIKIDIETATKDVLDDLNYTVVMSSDTASILATLINNNNFRVLMNNIRKLKQNKESEFKNLNDMRNVIQINDNYLKGIVRFLDTKLKFPNIFVIDEKSNTIYYKLMYLTGVQKISTQGLNTYISSALKTTIDSNNSVGSIYF